VTCNPRLRSQRADSASLMRGAQEPGRSACCALPAVSPWVNGVAAEGLTGGCIQRYIWARPSCTPAAVTTMWAVVRIEQPRPSLHRRNQHAFRQERGGCCQRWWRRRELNPRPQWSRLDFYERIARLVLARAALAHGASPGQLTCEVPRQAAGASTNRVSDLSYAWSRPIGEAGQTRLL